jgi:hypothetical protein
MREAPNVIMIGEIRDRTSMQHALHYAEAGHLCVSTLHANNASQAVQRVLNFFPKRCTGNCSWTCRSTSRRWWGSAWCLARKVAGCQRWRSCCCRTMSPT